MATVRAKGQDVRVTLTTPDGTADVINEGGIKSANIEFKMKLLDEGYLGETTNRKDDIFEGVSFEMEAHLTRPQYAAIVQAIVARSQRRTPAEAQFNMLMSITMGTGLRTRIVVEDAFFGPLPFNVGGRDEYVTVKISGEASSGRFLG